MIGALFNGLGTGFVLSFMLGTVFFALIQNSVNNGFRSGLLIALGVIVSDIIFISIAIFGTRLIPQLEAADDAIRLAGSALLIILGIFSMLKNPPRIKYPETRLGSFINYFSQGFFLNALNPVNFFSWASISTYINGALGYSFTQNILFFIGCLTAIFVCEGLISYFASRLKKFFTDKTLLWINRISGAAFIVFAVVLAWPVITGWTIELVSLYVL